jgi:hypothetical protein
MNVHRSRYYKASYVEQVSMDDFACAKAPGRGYRYLPADSEHVLLPAFHGLSYTTFKVTAPDAPQTIKIASPGHPGTAVELAVTVENAGEKYAGAETVLVFFQPENRTNPGGAELLPLQRRHALD